MKRRKPAEPTDEALAETRALARLHATSVLQELVRLAHVGESESVRLAAIKEILDRAYGRASSAAEGGVVRHLLVNDGYAD